MAVLLPWSEFPSLNCDKPDQDRIGGMSLRLTPGDRPAKSGSSQEIENKTFGCVLRLEAFYVANGSSIIWKEA